MTVVQVLNISRVTGKIHLELRGSRAKTSMVTLSFYYSFLNLQCMAVNRPFSKILLVITIANCQRAKILPIRARCSICSEMS